jgi:arylsulfatase A-like enzyme
VVENGTIGAGVVDESMSDLKSLITLTANTMPAGAAAGVVSGLWHSQRHGYLANGSETLVLHAVASAVTTAMVITAALVFLLAAAALLLGLWQHRALRRVALGAVLLTAALLFVNPRAVFPPAATRHPFTTAFLCAVALALFTAGPITRSRWARKLAVIPIAAAFAVALALSGGVLLLRHRASTVARPNVVLVVVDTLRADHLGAYGYPRATSPHLDQLAREATLFRRAYSQAPWTSPSIASLMTSRYPGELGYESSHHPAVLQPKFQTLAETLWEAGYQTRAFVSHVFVAPKLGFDQGFDGFSDRHARGAAYVSSSALVGDAIRYLDRARQPFFLFVHLFDPHFDYVEHAGHRFGDTYSGWLQSGLSISDLLRRAGSFAPEDLEHLLSLYDSEIGFTDEQIGGLLGELRRRGLFDGSWIIVAGDHGEAFLDRSDRWIGHGRTLYNELVHVPLIVKRPHQRDGHVIESPVGLVDVLPTVVGSLGIEVPSAVGARLPLAPDDEQEGDSIQQVFSETKTRGRWLQSVVVGDWKLIVDRESGDVELYDLETDPGERDDRSTRDTEVRQTLQKSLDAWAATVAPGRSGDSQEASFTEQELRNLKALGYLD